MAAIIALIHGEPGAYGISFPDFQGCISGGASIEEALRRGREAITFHIEGMEDVGEPFPKLREVAEIKADPEFADNFADATVAVVDVDLPARAVRVNISIDERLLQRADRAADAAGETRSGYIATALKQRLAGPATDDSSVYQNRKSKKAIGNSPPRGCSRARKGPRSRKKQATT
jgi:predicted RNase H-like HicB family nuclease